MRGAIKSAVVAILCRMPKHIATVTARAIVFIWPGFRIA
jgi:hypothetical protein